MENHEKALIQRLKNDALAVAGEINDMSYEAARKKKAEFLRKRLKEVRIICGAIGANGKICIKKPIEGSARCEQHGGFNKGPVTPEGKKKALANLSPETSMIHGMYARFVFTEEEELLYTTMMSKYEQVYELDLANLMMLDRVLRNFILNQRSVKK